MATPNDDNHINHQKNHANPPKRNDKIEMVKHPPQQRTHLSNHNQSIFSEGHHKASIYSHYSEGNHNNNQQYHNNNNNMEDEDFDIIQEVDEEFVETLGNDMDDILIDNIPNNIPVQSPETANGDSFVIKGHDEVYLDQTLNDDLDDLILHETKY